MVKSTGSKQKPKKGFLDISIVVPTRNNKDTIKNCLESLVKLDYPKNKYEIITSDGMSKDGTREIIAKYAKKYKKSLKISLIDNKKLNSAAGRNLAVKKAKNKIIAFTDSDCFVPKKWLKTLVNALKKHDSTDLAGVGGPNYPPSFSDDFAKAVGYAISTRIGSLGSVQGYVYKKPVEVISIPNCNALIKKEAIEKAGYYDEYFATGQDAEVNLRIRKKGFRFLFIPNAPVWHEMRNTPYKFFKRMYQYGFARMKIIFKHPDSLRPIHLLPVLAFIISLSLFISSLWYRNFLYILGLLVVIYVLMIFIGSLSKVTKERLGLISSIKFIFLMMLAFIIEYTGYTFGELAGIFKK
ncbi:glycosyltransferase [Nanoarchaeota archaeon]